MRDELLNKLEQAKSDGRGITLTADEVEYLVDELNAYVEIPILTPEEIMKLPNMFGSPKK